MRKTVIGSVWLIGMVSAGACLDTSESETQQLVQLPGAIFTTTSTGSIVNENVHYPSKSAVYLDGGPAPNAPPSAACLPAGSYYFMVTDPSGKDLLSTDAIGCRRFLVNSQCQLDYDPVGCPTEDLHVVGVDLNDGGDTIQLMDYLDTTNNGGEYKAWATPTSAYNLNAPNNTYGFVNSDSKTDNYKVRNPEEPPKEPCCGDGIQDAGEQCDDGDQINDDECTNACTLPRCGDGIYQPDAGEQCDDGNTVDDDTCTNDCKLCEPA